MRIAFLSWESLHSIKVGGLAVHTSELAKALYERGHEVHVFTRMGHGQPHYERIDGVHYHRCPFDLNPNFIQEMNNMSNSFAWHLEQTENYIGPFDIVHGHDWHVVNGLARIKDGRGRKIVWTIHSTEYGRCGNKFAGGMSEHIRNIEFYGTYIANKVITCSHAMKNETMWLYRVPEHKIAVVGNGIDVKKYEGYLDPGRVKERFGVGPVDPTILYVGRMAYQKGPDILIEAMPRILHENNQARAILVGDGHMRMHLESRARQLGVSHAVRFTGYVDDRDVLDLYKACEFVCVPSRNEPFGMVVLEAWASAKPVVVTHGGGPGEMVTHEVNGLKVYPNPDSIAWGARQMFSDIDRANWMGLNGRESAEKEHSWARKAREIEGVYEEVLSL
ncbi:MAG: glycosyltransferase family 4 protein [Candidatus Micrarchaeia archaeon]